MSDAEKKNREIAEFLFREGYIWTRRLESGQWIAVQPMLYTSGLFVLNSDPTSGWRTRYCYEKRLDALKALTHWDGGGDPPGPWIKQKPEERLNPNFIKS